MSEIVVEKFDDNVLWPGKICYALYKRYPNGFRFFLGHFRDKYAEKLKARVKERWEAKQKARKEYQEWKAELVAKGMSESDLPLSKRMFPPLLGEPTLADMYHYCILGDDDMYPKWEAERNIANELAEKAWELENLSLDGFVKVLPMTKYENLYYARRYIYDQPATDIRNRVQRRH